tara:strand:+ start:1008 stop:1208 length:201 start_codon:yes stop_codon:yes gene_type:complete
MARVIPFIQIVIATTIGCLFADIVRGYGDQCVSRDRSGCAETRVQCVVNNFKAPGVIPSCLIEKKI